jgi:tetratricopeptide (TPR) repeat protein
MSERRIEPQSTPSLGALDQLDLARPRRALPEKPPRRRGRLLVWLGLLALVVAAGMWMLGHWRESLGERLVPASDLNRQVAAAQQALARGELTAADGSGAREQFQSVLARDPDHPAARAGLSAVRDAALAQARAALETGDFALARSRLELARMMAAPAADLSLLELELQRLESTGADVADKLERARAAQAAGQLEQVPDGALALYSDVLRLQPDNAIALDGRRVILAGLLRDADAALDRGDVAAAQALVARVIETDPSHLDLPARQARLGEVLSQQQRVREDVLSRAAQAQRDGRLEDAAAAYLSLLASDPAAVEARQGLDDTAAAMAARAGREAADFDFDAAEASLRLARQWAPQSPAIAAAETRLTQSRAAREQVPAGGADPARLRRLVEGAQTAMRRGELIDPPGDSAWDQLRAASAIAPDDPQVRAALGEYDRRARACFEDELAGNRLSRAQACLDARAVRERGGDSLAGDRRRLADRWLAFAEERLGANELALARRALDSAQALDPTHPGLVLIAERLRRAGGN